MRIGIHTGEVTAGNVGAPGRSSYGIVGDVVNATQRIEQLAKTICHDRPTAAILVSGRTRTQAGEGFTFVEMGAHALRGRQEIMQIHRLVPMRVVSTTTPHQEPSADEPVPAAGGADGHRPGAAALACWRAAMLALMSSGPLAAAVGAAESCRTPGGQEQPPVAQLVSVVGEVTVRGVVQPGAQGTLPFVPICAGDPIAVGSASRAAVYVIEADTPLRLDEDTVGRIWAPPGPGSGIVELTRGAVYFLSQVRRTLTIRTPYVNAGIEGTEVYLRVREPAAAELIVLEGQVALAPGAATRVPFPAETAVTGEQAEVAADGSLRRTTLPSPGGRFGALREVAVGALSWTLFYPDVLTEADAAAFPRIEAAARLLAAGQWARLTACWRACRYGHRGRTCRRAACDHRGWPQGCRLGRAACRPCGRPGPRLPRPPARFELRPPARTRPRRSLRGGGGGGRAGTREPLPRARLAEIHLMRGETRQARRAAEEGVRLGGGPLAQMVLGFAELAALRGAQGEVAFRRALEEESWNPLAFDGIGSGADQARKSRGGDAQIENAVAHDPRSSLLRSYLGKAYFEERRGGKAEAVRYSKRT